MCSRVEWFSAGRSRIQQQKLRQVWTRGKMGINGRQQRSVLVRAGTEDRGKESVCPSIRSVVQRGILDSRAVYYWSSVLLAV